MDLRRATTPFLRLLPTPTSIPRPIPSACDCRVRTIRQQFARSTNASRVFSTSSRQRIYQTKYTNQQAAAVKEDTEADISQTPSQPTPNASQQSPSTTTRPQLRDRPTRQPNPNDDLDRLMEERVGDFKRAASRTRQRPASSFDQMKTTTSAPLPVSSHRVPIDRMQFPGSLRTASQPPSPVRDGLTTKMIPDTPPAPFRISAALGRSIDINPKSQDLARAFRQLEIRCGQNKVKSDLASQRFHERPGLRRKRLHSERWRRRFKADFQATVRRVEDLRRKGW